MIETSYDHKCFTNVYSYVNRTSQVLEVIVFDAENFLGHFEKKVSRKKRENLENQVKKRPVILEVFTFFPGNFFFQNGLKKFFRVR